MGIKVIEIALVALYAPGLHQLLRGTDFEPKHAIEGGSGRMRQNQTLGATRSHWMAVVQSLRKASVCSQEDCILALERAGLFTESLILASSARWRWAESHFANPAFDPHTGEAAPRTGRGALGHGQAASFGQGPSVLTALSSAYPLRWVSLLGKQAPPVIWRAGSSSPAPLRSITVVGSRHPSGPTSEWITSFCREASKSGYGIYSGGARGIDMLAERGALSGPSVVVEVMPVGFGCAWGVSLVEHREARGEVGPYHNQLVKLSQCPREASFSTGEAKARNRMLYAAGEWALVLEPRLGEGGSWHGALDALRQRLTPVAILADDSPASRALISLGAVPISRGASFAEANETVKTHGHRKGMPPRCLQPLLI